MSDGLGDARLTTHEYDGIREYDNPTPGWWHAIFVVSILYSILYFAFYTFSPMATSAQQAWRNRQVAEYKRVFGALGEMQPDEPTILKMMRDPRMMAIGEGTFIGNCAACHAKDGGGINGVNLTDNTYKNVQRLPDIFKTISKGAANGAMPSWENRLSQNERIVVAAYVAGLRGKTPGLARQPEGVEIDPWPLQPGAPNGP